MGGGGEFESILGKIFREAGWRAGRASFIADSGANLIVERREKRYAVKLKISSEGRRDRMIPLLAQAILEARAIVRGLAGSVIPVAVVAARRIPSSVAGHLREFAKRHALDTAVGVIDAGGFYSFSGHGLDGLEAKPSRRMVRQMASPRRPPDLFSGLNQWMLKILLGQRLPEAFLSVPRQQIRNASQLARAASVSVMSASRLVNQLAEENFLDENEESLQIVRAAELLERWAAANRKMSREIPAHWIIKQDEKQFFKNVAEYAAGARVELPPKSKSRGRRIVKAQPHCCLGLFAAASVLGLGFVRGVPPHLYLESLDLDVLQRLGLSLEDSGRRADVYIRVPSRKEAIFRAAVSCEGVPVSDVLQVWLDASAHPARGREQADEIRRRVLKPLFGKQR